MIKVPFKLEPDSNWQSLTKDLQLKIINSTYFILDCEIEVIGNIMTIRILESNPKK